MAAGDVTFTPTTGSAVSLTIATRLTDDSGAAARLALYRFLNVNGVFAIKLGADGRSLTVEGVVEAASEAALATALAALETAAKNASPGTLSLRGGAQSISNVVISAPPEFGEHLPAQPDGKAIQVVRLRFLQLA